MAHGKAAELRKINENTSRARRHWVTSGGGVAINYIDPETGKKEWGVAESSAGVREYRDMVAQAIKDVESREEFERTVEPFELQAHEYGSGAVAAPEPEEEESE